MDELTKAEREAAVALLTVAFDADPFFRFMEPDPRERAALIEEVMRGNVELALGAKNAFGLATEERVEGVCLWFAPGAYPPPAWRAALARGGSVARTIASWIAAPSRAKPEVITTALRIETLLDEGHPTEPYWYLQILGVDPTRQGRGIGSRMLREALAMADRDDVASVLETSKPANLRLYERYGFRITRTTRLDSSPPIWTMQRARGGHP